MWLASSLKTVPENGGCDICQILPSGQMDIYYSTKIFTFANIWTKLVLKYLLFYV